MHLMWIKLSLKVVQQMHNVRLFGDYFTCKSIFGEEEFRRMKLLLLNNFKMQSRFT